MNLLCSETVISNDLDTKIVSLASPTSSILSSSSSQSSSSSTSSTSTSPSLFHHYHQHQYQKHHNNKYNNNNNATTNNTYTNNNHHYNQHQQQQHHHQQQQQKNIEQNVQRVMNTARPDPTFLDDRCLENLLKADRKSITENNIVPYFSSQKDITPAMRKIVAEWMMEVCEENKCQEEVFLLALNYMDRFLATTSVRKTHLQILAAACLLLASKLREPSCIGLPAELLVFYTDNSITRSDLIHWELCVLSKLKWDISSVTPLDFLELLLIRLPIKNNKFSDSHIDKIRKHAQAFISLAAREHIFYMYSSSTIAVSSIAASLNGMHWHIRNDIQFIDLLSRLTELTGVEQERIHACMTKMEDIFEQQLKQQRLLPSYLINITAQNIILEVPQITTEKNSKSQAGTPTDVQDVKF